MDAYYTIDSNNSLVHHGIKGQKWGNRRYQNPDGSLTEEGRRRYGYAATDKGIYNKVKSQAIKGAKIGAGAGAALGGIATGLTMAGSVGSGFLAPPSVLMTIAAGGLASGAITGALDGVKIGAVVGGVQSLRASSFLRKDEIARTKIKTL